MDLQAAKELWGRGDPDAADEQIDAEGKPIKVSGEDPYLDGNTVTTPVVNPGSAMFDPRKEDEGSQSQPQPQPVTVAPTNPEPTNPEPANVEPVEGSPEENVFVVGGKEIDEDDYGKIVESLTKQFGEDEIKVLSPKVLEALVVEKHNLLQGSRSLNARNQEVAKQRREHESLRQALEDDRATIEEKKKAAERDYEDKMTFLETKEQEYNETLSDLEAKIEKQKSLLNRNLADMPGYEDAYDSEDRARLQAELATSKAIAKDKLATLEEQKEKTAGVVEQIAEEREKVIRDADQIDTYMSIMALQQNFPELQTEANVLEVLKEYMSTNGKYSGNQADLIKAMRIYEVINKHGSQNLTDNVVDYYNVQKYNLPSIEKLAQPGKKSVKEVKQDNVRNTILDIIKKQKTSGVPAPTGGSARTIETYSVVQEDPENYKKKTGWA